MEFHRFAARLAFICTLAHSLNAQTNLVPIWKVTVPGSKVQTGAAFGSDGTIYVTADGAYAGFPYGYSGPAQLHALNGDGTLRWSYLGGKGEASAPTVGSDGTIYFASVRGEDGVQFIHAVDPDGKERWRRDWAEPVTSYMTVLSDGSVLAKTHYGRLYRFDAAGNPTLVVEEGGIGASVVGVDGTIFSGTGSAQVNSFSLEGRTNWSFSGYWVGVVANGLALGPEGSLYVAGQSYSGGSAYGGEVCALNLDGTLRWRYQPDLEVFCAPAISPEGILYVATRRPGGGGALIRMEPSGQPISTNMFAGALRVTPALATDGSLWVVDDSGRLTRMSAQGEELGVCTLKGMLGSPVLSSNGLLVVTTESRGVAAFVSAPAVAAGWSMEGRNPQRTHRSAFVEAPPRIQGVRASEDLPYGVLISWPVAGPVQYEIWRGLTTNVQEALPIVKHLVGTAQYLDTNVLAGALRYYWVRAQNLGGVGGFGSHAAGFRPLPGLGGEMWHVVLEYFAIEGIAASVNGSLYVSANNNNASFPGEHNGRLAALSEDGRLSWTKDFPLLLAQGPVLGRSNQVVVTQRLLGGALAYGEDGGSLWTYGDSMCLLPPALGSDGRFYFRNRAFDGSGAGGLCSVSPEGQSEVVISNMASADGPAYIVPPLLAGVDRLWLGGNFGISLWRVGSSFVWQNFIQQRDTIGMAPGPQGGVYFANRDELRSVGSDGRMVWQIKGVDFSSGMAVGSDGNLYVGTVSKGLISYSPEGVQRWVAPLEGAVRTTPALGEDGSIFVGTDAGKFYALGPEGNLRWKFDAESAVTAPATVLPQGWVLFGTKSGYVWSLRADTRLADGGWPKFQGDLANSGNVGDASLRPSVSSNLVASVLAPGGTVVHLKWDAAQNGETYEVWRSQGTSQEQAQLVISNLAVQLEFGDLMTRAGEVYTYWVRARNAQGFGPWSTGVQGSQTNLLWLAPVLSGVAPVVDAQGCLYSAGKLDLSDDAFMASYDPSGELRWKTQIPSTPRCSPVLGASSRLLVACRPSAVVSLSTSGVWAGKMDTGLSSDLNVDPAADAAGTGYFGSDQGSLYAVSADAVALWELTAIYAKVHASVGAMGETYKPFLDGMAALSVDGTVLWKLSSPLGFTSPSLDSNGDLLAFNGDYASKLLRITPAGKVVSTNDSGTGLQFLDEPLIASDGRVYAVGRKGSLRSLCAFDAGGSLLWSNRLAALSVARANVPALDRDGNVYVLGSTNLLVFDRAGQPLKSLELPAAPSACLVLTDQGRIFVPSVKGIAVLNALAPLDSGAPWPMYRHDPQGTASHHRTLAAPEAPILAVQEPFTDRVRITTTRTLPPSTLELFRSPNPMFSSAVHVATGRAGEAFVDDKNVQPGVANYYWVRAVNSGGSSGLSGPIQRAAVSVPLAWFREIPELGLPAIAIGPEGNTYLSDATNLFALNPQGQTLWHVPSRAGSPVVSPNADILLRDGEKLTCLSPLGATNWVDQDRGGCGRQTPAVTEEGTILLPCDTGSLDSLGADGRPGWRVSTGLFMPNSPSVSDSGEIVMLTGSQLTRLAKGAAAPIGIDLANYYQGNLVPVLGPGGTLYLAGMGSRWEALGPDNASLWQVSGTDSFTVFPVLGNDGVVFGGTTVTNPAYRPFNLAGMTQPSASLHPASKEPRHLRKVVAVLPDGSIKWSYRVEANPTYLALAANGTLIVSSGLDLCALAAENGVVLWKCVSPNGETMGVPLIDAAGILHVPVRRGVLALDIGSGPADSCWPMFRQNARQSACVPRGSEPGLRMTLGTSGPAALEVRAPTGAMLLKSQDLEHWEWTDFQPASTNAIRRQLGPEAPMEFFRALAP